MLSDKESARYARHLLLREIGEAGQERLKNARVLVIGAGGLGCPALLYLAAAGVGTIGIVDGDTVDESNLHRQVLYSSEDVGKKKAEVAREKLARQNPFIRIHVHPVTLTSSNALDILKDYDLVLDGSDNFPTRYLSNDACVILGKPLVFGSIFKFEGQVSVFNYKGGPTYRCLFPVPPGPGEVPNCAQVGVLGVLPGIIGSFMANEAMKVILDAGEVLSGKLFVLDTLSMRSQVLRFDKNPAQAAVKGLVDYEEFCGLKTKTSHMKEISPSEFKRLKESGAPFHLIDVREEFEYKAGHLGGTLIPLATVREQAHRIPKEGLVIIHCKAGARSKRAIEFLEKELGYKNLTNLSGGYDACQGIIP